MSAADIQREGMFSDMETLRAEKRELRAEVERLQSTLVTKRDMEDARKLVRHLDLEDNEGEDTHDIAQAIANGRRALEGT